MTDLMMKLDTVEAEQVAHVEAFGGAHIARACEQATKIATILGVVVHFDFNGVKCYARPDSDWRTLMRRWEELMEQKERSQFAMAWSDVSNS
jgi:hypothetical protein